MKRSKKDMKNYIKIEKVYFSKKKKKNPQRYQVKTSSNGDMHQMNPIFNVQKITEAFITAF